MKFRYVPGNYPVPMLAIEVKANADVFNSMIQEPDFIFKSEDQFTPKYKHAFNMNAYIIYDENECKVIAIRTTSFPHLVYLFRSLGKPFEFELEEQEYQTIKGDFENLFKDEFCKVN